MRVATGSSSIVSEGGKAFRKLTTEDTIDGDSSSSVFTILRSRFPSSLRSGFVSISTLPFQSYLKTLIVLSCHQGAGVHDDVDHCCISALSNSCLQSPLSCRRRSHRLCRSLGETIRLWQCVYTKSCGRCCHDLYANRDHLIVSELHSKRGIGLWLKSHGVR